MVTFPSVTLKCEMLMFSVLTGGFVGGGRKDGDGDGESDCEGDSVCCGASFDGSFISV